MSKLERSRLLGFLSKPRFGREIAEHFDVPIRLVNYHLREVVKSGQVLISEKPVFRTLSGSNGKPRRFNGFVYVFKNSPLIIDGGAKFTVKEADNLLESSQLSSLSRLETKSPFRTKFDVSSDKLKLAKRKTVDELLRHRLRSTEDAATSLSYAERTRLFQALLNEPLPLLELHGRFGVSKQMVRGLVKKGLLAEDWGPKAIGVKFKLTKKGKVYLKELKVAARYEPAMRKNPFIKLKHITSI